MCELGQTVRLTTKKRLTQCSSIISLAPIDNKFLGDCWMNLILIDGTAIFPPEITRHETFVKSLKLCNLDSSLENEYKYDNFFNIKI